MSRRLDSYEVHDTPKLRFYNSTSGHLSAGSYVETHHVIVSKSGKGKDRTITFRDFKNGMEWTAYRWHGHWAYGSGAWRLAVED